MTAPDASNHCARPGRTGTAPVAVSIALAGLLLAAPVAADVYKFVDENGVIHLADRKLGPGYKLIMRGGTRPLTSPARSPSMARYQQNRRTYTPLIDSIARRVGLESALVHAVVTAESAYDPGAISRAGAVGLMQLMPGTAARYGVRDRHDPAQNVEGGTRYLRDLLVQFRDVTLALAAYNAGENAVVAHGHDIPPYPETREYVRKVLRLYRDYRTSL